MAIVQWTEEGGEGLVEVGGAGDSEQYGIMSKINLPMNEAG